MSDTSPYGFELVRRGYDRAQVDERISKLVSDRDSALNRITALEKRIDLLLGLPLAFLSPDELQQQLAAIH